MTSKGQEQQRQAAIGLLKRLPPQHVERYLAELKTVAPTLDKSLASFAKRPLQVMLDAKCERQFIKCDFNFDDGAHRSPWTNQYLPSPSGATEGQEEKRHRPSERLRKLEETFNEVFDEYRASYYEGGVSSVYVWDLDEGFSAAFLIRKELKQQKGVEIGSWDSVHVVEVRESPATGQSEYRLSTTVTVHAEVGPKSAGRSELASRVTRHAEDRKKKKVSEDQHIVHIGRLIEDMETHIRQYFDTCIAKQREVLDHVRVLDPEEPRLSLPAPTPELAARAAAEGA